MKNEVVILDRNKTDQIAERYFIKMCGFNQGQDIHKTMLQDGYSIRDKLLNESSIKAIISSFDKSVISEKTVDINGIKFECNAFRQIDKENINKIYIYILTAGHFELPDASMLELVYADAWGTAYVDAGRDILRSILSMDNYINQIERENDNFLSDSFGPGYYGMDITQVMNFFKVLDSGKIGVSVRESGLMEPAKSIAGFYIAVKDKNQIPGKDCQSCLSNAKGCYYCRAKNKQNFDSK